MVWFIIRDNIIYNWIIESEFLNGFMEIGCLKLFEENESNLRIWTNLI